MKSINMEGGFYFVEGEIFQITLDSGINVAPWINVAPGTFGKNNKHRGWNIFWKSIKMEGGFYFVEGEIFQIIREMTGENCQITKRGRWNKRGG